MVLNHLAEPSYQISLGLTNKNMASIASTLVEITNPRFNSLSWQKLIHLIPRSAPPGWVCCVACAVFKPRQGSWADPADDTKLHAYYGDEWKMISGGNQAICPECLRKGGYRYRDENGRWRSEGGKFVRGQ